MTASVSKASVERNHSGLFLVSVVHLVPSALDRLLPGLQQHLQSAPTGLGTPAMDAVSLCGPFETYLQQQAPRSSLPTFGAPVQKGCPLVRGFWQPLCTV